MADVTHVEDANFETDVVSSQLPVLVDFLGPMVRPVSLHRPTYRNPGKGVRRKTQSGQNQCGRQPIDPFPFQRAGDPQPNDL